MSRRGMWAVVLWQCALLALVEGESLSNPARASDAELHVVSVYGGKRSRRTADETDIATVQVDRPGKVVVLAVSSGEALRWRVVVSPGTKVSKVVLCGYRLQDVVDLPKGIDVLRAFHEGREGELYIRFPYVIERASFRPSILSIHHLTGLEVASFQGQHESDREKPFVVNQVQDDPRLHSEFPIPTKASEIPNVQFQALCGSNDPAENLYPVLCDFDTTGPDFGTKQKLPKPALRLVEDPVSGKRFGVKGSRVIEFDMKEESADFLVPPLEVFTEPPVDPRRILGASALAFDTTRQRLVISTFEHVYGYSPKTHEWSRLDNLARLARVRALAYEANGDCFYALGVDHGDGNELPKLYQFSADGVLKRTRALGVPFFPGLLGEPATVGGLQLIAADGHLVILTGVDADESKVLVPESFMYLIDPKTDKMWLTWKW